MTLRDETSGRTTMPVDGLIPYVLHPVERHVMEQLPRMLDQQIMELGLSEILFSQCILHIPTNLAG
jgi:hypothetical protein